MKNEDYKIVFVELGDKSYSEKKLIPTQKEWKAPLTTFNVITNTYSIIKFFDDGHHTIETKHTSNLINNGYNETLHFEEMIKYYYKNPNMLEFYLKKLIKALENNIKIKHC